MALSNLEVIKPGPSPELVAMVFPILQDRASAAVSAYGLRRIGLDRLSGQPRLYPRVIIPFAGSFANFTGGRIKPIVKTTFRPREMISGTSIL